MNLAYSTNAFTQYPLVEALNHIADIGYSGVEILCERPHWYPPETGFTQVDQVIEVLSQRNLKVSNLNANTANSFFSSCPPENTFEPALTNINRDIRLQREGIVKQAIKLADRVGASCISVTSGSPTPGCLPEKAVALFVDSLKSICDFAENYAINVGIEYEPGLIIERSDEVCELIHEVGSPRLGVNLDIGHSYLSRENPEKTIENLAGRIWNVHVEDIKGMKHFHLPPGEGDLPFQQYFHAFKKINYSGFLTVELYSFPDQPIEVGSKAHDYLSNLLGVIVE